MLGVFAAGCSKDDPVGRDTEPSNTDIGVAQLTISATSPLTRAADESGENTIVPAHGLKVYVFSEAGELVYSSASEPEGVLQLNDGEELGTYTTEPFEMPSGALHFFVFANDPSDLIPVPTTATTMEVFKRMPVTATYGGADESLNRTLDIAADGSFLMGTSWKVLTDVAAGGTASEPVEIGLEIGRLASKVTLMNENLTSEIFDGSFAAPTYRLGTLAKVIHTAGVFVGDLHPLAPNRNVLVYSYTHEKPYVIETYGQPSRFNDVDFVQYTAFQSAGPGTKFYATESTAARDAVNGAQHYGDVTYIQIRTVYTPDAEEIINPADDTPGTLTGNTFWAGFHEGVTKIYSADPTDLVADIINVTHYPAGVMYYKFPVFDPGESDYVVRNRVLRNYSYEFTVTNIKELGVPEEEVDYEEPIAELTTVDVTVKVRNWDKVTGELEL